MLEPGTAIKMTKGYRGVKGEILERAGSQFEFYVLRLENGIHLVAGPTAFEVIENEERSEV
jgi:hypothetical protein